MKRERARTLLPDYLNGHLAGREKKDLEELLSRDGELRREAEETKREFAVLREAAIDPHENIRLKRVTSAVIEQIEANDQVKSLLPQLPWYSWASAAALAAIAIVAVILYPSRPVSIESTEKELFAEAVIPKQTVRQQQPVEVIPELTQTPEQQVETTEPQADEKGPDSIRMSFATNDPKVKIYWTFSKDFDENAIGE